MTRAFAFRLLLTVLAVTSIVVAEARLIGLWTGAELPVNVVHAPSGLWVVRPLDDVPLPSPLRDGDVLVLKDMTRAARVAGEFGFAMPAGISFEFPVIQEGRLVYASVVTRVTKSSALERGGQWLNALFVVPLLAALALLPLWRGRGRASGRLCAFSMFALVGTAMSSAVMRPLLGFWLNETLYLSQFLVGFPALYVMAEALAESGLSRRMLRMTRFAFVGIDLAAVATAATATFGFVYGGLSLPRALDTLLPLLLASLLISLALLVLFAGYRKADHESRLRIRWVLWSTAVFLVVVIGLLGISANRHPYLFQAVHSMQWLVLLGYFYAAFRKRLTGAVICHPRDGEQFAPDVRAALVEAARNLGMSLYVLRYREQARLLADVAAGRMDLVAARSRASESIPGAVA